MSALSGPHVLGIAVAAGVGLAIGLERGWKELDAQIHSTAGIRTFTLTGLLGGVCGWLQANQVVDVVVPGFAAIVLLAIVAYVIEVQSNADPGLTTEVALLTTFVLGATAGMGYWAVAGGAAVATALILGLKAEIHNLVRHLEHKELLATLQLLVLSVLVLPMLPSEDVFDIQGFNPRTIGTLTLLISVISYVGYFSVQILGRRKGLLLTAALGGLTSSTAVAISFSRLARSNAHAHPELGAGIALASAVMVPRMLLIIALVSPALIPSLLWPLLTLMFVPVLWALLQINQLNPPQHNGDLQLKNPLALGTALGFAILLILISISLPIIKQHFGSIGVYALAALSGLGDVDALMLSIARDTDGLGTSVQVGATAIVIAAMVNTLLKAAVTVFNSNGHLRSTGAALVAGAMLAGLTLWLLT